MQKEIEFAVQKDTYRQQNAQAINTVFDNLERRLQETEEAKKNIDPNELTSAGISAESVKIEGGNITNKSLIQAGHIAIIGDAVLNENGTIVSRGDLNIQAGDFQNFGADLIAGNDMTINADNVEIGTISFKTSDLGGVGNKTSNLFGNNITINSNNDAKFTSVNMEATNNLSISALGDVSFNTAQNITVTQTSSTKTELGFFQVKKTTKTTTTTTKTNIANSLKGNNISITAGGNLEGFNVKADAKESLAMSAGNDLTLSTKADEKIVEEHKVETTTGLFVDISDTPNRVSFGVSVGVEEVTTDTNTNIKTHNNQTLSANNITLSSGNKTTLESVDTKSENISISGKDVTITALSDEYTQNIHREDFSVKVGVDLGVGKNPLGDGISTHIGETITRGNSDSSLFHSSTSSSNIMANNIKISTENSSGKQKGDINIIGSNIQGDEILLSGKTVNITAQENKTTYQSSSMTKSLGMGIALGVNMIDIFTAKDYAEIRGDSSSKSFDSTTHTGSTISGSNITINAKNDTNIIGSSINASGDTKIKANNVYLGSTTDTHLNYQYGYGVGVGVDIGYSQTTAFNMGANANASADATFNAGSKINNASINSDNLTITTHKNLIHPLHSLIKGNGSLTLNGGNINVKNEAKITLADNLIISSQHDTSVKGNMDFGADMTLRGNIMSGLLLGGGKINAEGEATLNSMSGISAGSVQISTSSSFPSQITGVAVGGLTDVVLGIAGKAVGQVIAHIASDKIGEVMQGEYSQEEIKKTQNFVKSLGKPLGNVLQKNHTEIANVVFETVKGGNTSITNGYIQSTDPSKTSSISTDKLVYHDIGNIKFDTTQKISMGGIVTPLFLPELGGRVLKDAIEGKSIGVKSFLNNFFDTLRPSMTIGGSPINIETSKNHSSISSSIQITSTNQSDITRGDKQKEPSGFKKDKINTQTININPSKIIEKVM